MFQTYPIDKPWNFFQGLFFSPIQLAATRMENLINAQGFDN
jgi:hypothetical protein